MENNGDPKPKAAVESANEWHDRTFRKLRVEAANAPAAQPDCPYGELGCQVSWGGITHSGPARVKVKSRDKTVFQICQAHLDYILIQQIGQPEGKGNYWTVIENLPAAPPAPEGQTIGAWSANGQRDTGTPVGAPGGDRVRTQHLDACQIGIKHVHCAPGCPVASQPAVRGDAAVILRKLLLQAGEDFTSALACYCGEVMDADGNLDEKAKCLVCQGWDALREPAVSGETRPAITPVMIHQHMFEQYHMRAGCKCGWQTTLNTIETGMMKWCEHVAESLNLELKSEAESALAQQAGKLERLHRDYKYVCKQNLDIEAERDRLREENESLIRTISNTKRVLEVALASGQERKGSCE